MLRSSVEHGSHLDAGHLWERVNVQEPGDEETDKKLAASVGKFSHSAVNSSELKNVQELQKTFSKVYELIRRNDTRWVVL